MEGGDVGKMELFPSYHYQRHQGSCAYSTYMEVPVHTDSSTAWFFMAPWRSTSGKSLQGNMCPEFKRQNELERSIYLSLENGTILCMYTQKFNVTYSQINVDCIPSVLLWRRQMNTMHPDFAMVIHFRDTTVL